MDEEKKNLIKELIVKKDYSALEDLIQPLINNETKDVALLNLLAVAKQSKKNRQLSDIRDSIKLYRQAFLIDEKHKEVLLNLAYSSIKIWEFNDALFCLNRFYERNKSDYEVSEVLARINYYIGNIDEAIDNTKQILNNKKAFPDVWTFLLSILNFSNKYSQKDYLGYCKEFSKKIKSLDESKLVKYEFALNPKKIRIGFLSPDFKDHSVFRFLRDFLISSSNLDVEFIAFSNLKKNEEDNHTSELKNIFSEFYAIKDLDDLELTNFIREQKINILIDLATYTSGTRISILKHRPAPIQMSWLGFCNTSGFDEVDYLIADKYTMSPEIEKSYLDKVIKMTNIWNSHSAFKENYEIKQLPAIKNKFVTFGSFNHFKKINDEVIHCWSLILKSVKNSRLVIKSSASVSETSIENLIKKFKKNGIQKESIDILKRTKLSNDHIKSYNMIDIALDTFPYNGVTTTFESIWMGVPVIVIKGNTFSSRCGYSINKNLNLNEFISSSKEDYVQKAITLSKDIDNLKNIRENLRYKALKSPLFNNKNFAIEFTDQMKKIWKVFVDKRLN